MKAPTKEIQADLNYFKYEANLYCRNCKQYKARFTYIQIIDNVIHEIMNCSECGESGEYVMSYEKLREVYYTKDLKGDRLTLWKFFNLGLYYNQVFQFEHEKKKYVKLVCRLNRDTEGWRKIWYGRKYKNAAN